MWGFLGCTQELKFILSLAGMHWKLVTGAVTFASYKDYLAAFLENRRRQGKSRSREAISEAPAVTQVENVGGCFGLSARHGFRVTQ